ncbi:alpha/beta-hydrolase [Hesseltinella vesiculosa]|uniref:Alpha/beta-hydrolase n=1 Tax=Hesseltinella vesiculosa TaxID=101127 RepID=A0A1X2GVZ7_9FUNG|nr:alpha/beta-hydrolase [Hesseltinella vesiculosa]
MTPLPNMTTVTYQSAYGNEGDIDIYIHDHSTDETPLIVFIHGGAWRTEDKKDHSDLALELWTRGYTVAVPNYRLSLRDPGSDSHPLVQHPDHIQDTYDALKYLHNQAPAATFDKNKMVLVGHSAGAHIATMLLLEQQYEIPFVAGIVGADGIYDLPLLLRTFPDYLDFISQAFGDDASTYANASPSHVPAQLAPSTRQVPVLLVQSLEDQLIDVAQTQSMLERLQAVGVTSVAMDTTTCRGGHYEMIKTSEFYDLVQTFTRKL